MNNIDLNSIVLFESIKTDKEIQSLVEYINNEQKGDDNLITHLFNTIITFAQNNNLSGNIYKQYIIYKLCNDENAFSLSLERNNPTFSDSIYEVAADDLEIILKLINLNISTIKLGKILSNYHNNNSNNSILQQKLNTIDYSSIKSILITLAEFYYHNGVSKYAFNNAFRVNDLGAIEPVDYLKTKMDDLIGYEDQKHQLIENTECFIDNKPANNVLLYGEAGTGKSTCIKSLANKYFDKGVRLIEVYKYQFRLLPKLISELKKRNYKFILYMDDLSFEDFETEYKYLKAVIEGGVEEKPKNILIYATSNRRHLIKETWKDRELDSQEINRTDTMQEKISLSARFGITINFIKPTKEEFNKIVIGLAEKEGLNIPQNELLKLANQWELRHGGVSGRVARQLIDYLQGKN